MGKMEKKWKEIHVTKAIKIPQTKRQKYGINKTLVACATVYSKSGVILLYNNTSHADCLVVFVLRKEGRNFIMMQDKKPCANYAQRAKQMQYVTLLF